MTLYVYDGMVPALPPQVFPHSYSERSCTSVNVALVHVYVLGKFVCMDPANLRAREAREAPWRI